VFVATIAVWLRVDEESVIEALQEAGEKLDSVDGEVALDFSSVRRIDASALRVIAEFTSAAGAKGIKVALRGVNVGVYKVLKLARLTSRFSFVN
jgi:anti-anti-sigma regulatory factor